MYREEIAQGERAVAKLKRQQAAYEARVGVVTTEWNTLRADIALLAARVTGGAEEEPPAAASDEKASFSSVALADPFLGRLVQRGGASSSAAETRKRPREEDGDGDEREGDGGGSGSDSEDADAAAPKLDADDARLVDALRAKAAETKAALARVLDAVDAANASQTNDRALGGDAKLEAALKDLANARSRADALDANAARDAAALERLRETATKQRKRNDELGAKLSDALADAELLRRQLRVARSNAGQIEGLPPMATAAGAAERAGRGAAAAAGRPRSTRRRRRGEEGGARRRRGRRRGGRGEA